MTKLCKKETHRIAWCVFMVYPARKSDGLVSALDSGSYRITPSLCVQSVTVK